MTSASVGCRGCGGTVRRPFFSLDAVPVGSCVLLDSQEKAREYPTGRIDLEICERCGLIQNASFDESLVDYTSGYEESQGYSPTFLAYADALIRHLDDRYALSGETIVEPGCGKGEFLVRLCETIDASGIGIDPAYVPGRLETGANVEFHRELFTTDSPHTGKLVICRHTLEHIEEVHGFLTAMRSSAVRTDGAVGVVEVPDTRRILDEGAFWDVYYEHASYFTDVSLRTAALHAGFEPRDVRLWFADQYLILEATVADPDTGEPPSDEVAEVLAAADGFAKRTTESIAAWRSKLEAAGRPVLWGASSKAVGFMAAIDVPHLVGAVDINPFKQGSFLAGSGIEILAPDALPAIAPDLVVVMNPIYTEEIANDVAARGVTAEIVAC